MYRNALTPSRLFAITLLLFAAAGLSIWLTCLVDVDEPAFDTGGLILLGLTMALLVLSVLFLRRVRWARVVMSILLHVLALSLLGTLLSTVPAVESLLQKMMVVALTLLGAGLLLVGILALHHDAMKNDFAAARARNQAHRARRRPYFAAGAGGILLLLMVGAWQVVPLLLAKPTVTIDYLAQANQTIIPVDYDPNHNAAPHYEKLFAQLTSLPEALKDRHRSWPADLDPEEFKALAEWVSANETALSALAHAARCPYWWYELKSSDGALSGIQTPDLDHIRNCARGALLLAKYKAYQGNVGRALQILSDLHMFGVHQATGATLLEQLTGLAVCELSYGGVLAILGRCQVEGQILRQTLDTFAPRLAQINVPRFSEVEYLYGYDNIQRMFTDDGNGNGRLIPTRLYESKKEGPHLYRQPIPYLDAVRVCLTHPDRRETTQLFESYFAMVKELARRTPLELDTEDASYEERLNQWLLGNYYLEDGCVAVAQCIRIGWRGRVSGEATVAILAVRAYEAQEGRLPESLRQLVDKDLLPSVPMDPYRGAPLIYTVDGNDFTLYSVGEDCVDDDGVPCEWNDEYGGDHVFWPISYPAPPHASNDQ